MNRRNIFYLLVSLIIVLGFTTGGFQAYESMNIDRANSMDISDKNDGIVELTKSEEVGATEVEELVYVSNPLNESIYATVKLSNSNPWSFEDGSTEKTLYLAPGETASFAVLVSDLARNNVFYNYEIKAEDSGGNFLFSQTDTVRIINNILDIEGDVSTSGASGKYSFTISNNGNYNVSLTQVEIVSTTNPDATSVRRGGILTFEGQQIIYDEIQVGGSAEDVQGYVKLSTGETYDFTFDRFSRGNPPADMRGETVTLRLYFGGSGSQDIVLGN